MGNAKIKYTANEIVLVKMGFASLQKEFKDAVVILGDKDYNDLMAGLCTDEKKLYWAGKAFREGERLGKEQARKMEAYYKSTPNVRLVHQIIGEAFRDFKLKDYGNMVVHVAGLTRILMEKGLVTQEEIDAMNDKMKEEAKEQKDDLKERAKKSGIILP